MTEIPEHLLKRSKERRAAMGLGGESAGDAAATGEAPAAATSVEASGVDKPAVAPAAARAAAPAEVVAAPPPPPDPPYVAAAKSRKKVPMWAAPVLAMLPLWGFIYFQSLQKPEAGANDPLALGAQIYNVKGGCAGCHGSDGGGGVGAKLSGGETLKTFKNPLAMVHWIAFGADGGARDNGTYGDLDRPGGPHNTATLPAAMPAQMGKLTPEEIAAVTMYVRQTIDGSKDEKGFAVADFPTLGEVVTKVTDLGPGGDPKVPGATATKAPAAKAKNKGKGKGTSGSGSGSAGGSGGAGSAGGSTGAGTNSSGGAGNSGTNSSGGSGSSGTNSSGSGDSGQGGTPGGGGSDQSGTPGGGG